MFDFFSQRGRVDSSFWIFLDVDGVLNREEDWRFPFRLNSKNVRTFQAAYASLQNICNPSIILSSSWRRGWNAANQPDYLKELCRELPIAGRTPVSPSGDRGREIERYLARRGRPDSFVAVDDDPSGLERLPSLIVSSKTGFTDRDAKRLLSFAQSHLGNNNPRPKFFR